MTRGGATTNPTSLNSVILLDSPSCRLGFTNIVTIDEVKQAFPLLDIVDHSNRTWIAKNGITKEHSLDEFEPIEG